MAYFKKCCCCVSLKTGGVVLGILAIISGVIVICAAGMTILTLESMTNLVQNGTGVNITVSNSSSASNWPNEEDPELAKIILRVLQGYMGLSAVFAFITIVCAILLIYGALKGSKNCILPFLVLKAIELFFNFLYFVYEFYVLFSPKHAPKKSAQAEDPHTAERGISAIIGGLLYIGVAVYLWFCVLSLYQELRDETRRLRVAESKRQQEFHQSVAYSPVTEK